jgi:hypothetical protein
MMFFLSLEMAKPVEGCGVPDDGLPYEANVTTP